MNIKILRPEDIELHQPIGPRIDAREAAENIRKAIEATEKLRRFVEIRDSGLFSDLERESTGNLQSK